MSARWRLFSISAALTSETPLPVQYSLSLLTLCVTAPVGLLFFSSMMWLTSFQFGPGSCSPCTSLSLVLLGGAWHETLISFVWRAREPPVFSVTWASRTLHFGELREAKKSMRFSLVDATGCSYKVHSLNCRTLWYETNQDWRGRVLGFSRVSRTYTCRRSGLILTWRHDNFSDRTMISADL